MALSALGCPGSTMRNLGWTLLSTTSNWNPAELLMLRRSGADEDLWAAAHPAEIRNAIVMCFQNFIGTHLKHASGVRTDSFNTYFPEQLYESRLGTKPIQFRIDFETQH
jgi:hypothetical protein